MDRVIRLIVAYDGTDFHGWQRQPDLRTVQGTLEDAARRVVRSPLTIVGASRTDAGVHARGQVAAIWMSGTIPVSGLQKAINHRLPPDVSIVHAREMPLTFHPIRQALGKHYRYRLHAATSRPTDQGAARRSWHVWTPIDLDRMQDAGDRLVGTHDFAGFASTGSDSRGVSRYSNPASATQPLETTPDVEFSSTVRTIHRVRVWRRCENVTIDVEGVSFLYNQVRNMVGTLVEIARGHWPPQRIDEIIAARDRRLAGPPAPPQGLCLEWVRYAPILKEATEVRTMPSMNPGTTSPAP
ncbi:MAG: tRNA pseudouridine synthase A [Phycisphaerae bacterium]